MPKHILVLGAGKSATCLINYLLEICTTNQWTATIADSDLSLVQSKVPATGPVKAVALDVTNPAARSTLIGTTDLVIALLPPFLVPAVAADCVRHAKHLLTASYLDEPLRAVSGGIGSKGVLFLCEMGLDPGIDHMSAMKRIDTIRVKGGQVTSFISHCGGLVSPGSDDNPWHYKVSWNPRNIVLAGNQGARYKEDGQVVEKTYQELFQNCKEVDIPALGRLAYYPNRDSLHYQQLYHLEEAQTFMRNTLRHPAYPKAWHAIVNAGLTSTAPLPGSASSFRHWSQPVQPFVTPANREQLDFLGLLGEQALPARLTSSADIVQYLFETRLGIKPTDRDMIVMLHQIEYRVDGQKHLSESTLIVHGKSKLETAMARTVGLPLGIAARLILEGRIRLTGLHIPVLPEIYMPVLNALEVDGICFEERDLRL